MGASSVLSVSEQLGDPRTWGERAERFVATGRTYPDGDTVRILVRKRGRRYDLDDRGDAVRKAHALGAREAWLGVAEDVVSRQGFNVNRRGVVFVSAVEGRDLASLAQRLGDCAYAVHAELVDSTAS